MKWPLFFLSTFISSLLFFSSSYFFKITYNTTPNTKHPPSIPITIPATVPVDRPSSLFELDEELLHSWVALLASKESYLEHSRTDQVQSLVESSSSSQLLTAMLSHRMDEMSSHRLTRRGCHKCREADSESLDLTCFSLCFHSIEIELWKKRLTLSMWLQSIEHYLICFGKPRITRLGRRVRRRRADWLASKIIWRLRKRLLGRVLRCRLIS